MTRVLVLGGTMFFGKRLVQLLLNNGYEVTVATRGNATDPFGNQVERIILDRADRESVVKGLENKKWDIIYDQTAYSPNEVKDVLDVVGDNCMHYVFTSTMAVYKFGNAQAEENFDPTTFSYVLKNRTQYSGMEGYQEAKRACEAYLLEHAPYPVSIVRFPLVIGPDDYTNRLKDLVEKVKEGKEIEVTSLDNGLGFISSEKASEFLYWLGTNQKEGIWNAALDGFVTHGELLNKIETTVGKSAYVVETENLSPSAASAYAMKGSWSLSADKAVQEGFSFGSLEEVLVPLIRSYKAGKY
ncbi:NAD-dependent epimerase/dehydratase family protein [Bacillus sp. BGMRC 2118]|nr:NAD-dependent epimerase/dehydratase family protein [Bacillus sp. BGMRC 2118]